MSEPEMLESIKEFLVREPGEVRELLVSLNHGPYSLDQKDVEALNRLTDEQRDMLKTLLKRQLDEHRARLQVGDPWEWRDGKVQLRVLDNFRYPYSGPFRVGDDVLVNGSVSGVIRLLNSEGMLVVPTPSGFPGQQAAAPGAWFNANGVQSIAMNHVMKVHAVEGEGSPPGDPGSLPMRPPPVLEVRPRG